MGKYSNGLADLLNILPPVIREKLHDSPDLQGLIEVVLDYGRPAEIRFRDRLERLSAHTISEHDLEYVVKSLGEFGDDNRAGIERTLHRISAIRNRHGKVVGLTCRVGRALEGTIEIIDDIVRSGKSVLLLGKPGVGKTTKLREVARVLSDEADRRVVIIDTSNEIGGDGDIPHPAIGYARRMQVPTPTDQHAVMIEAVENHMPEVIVIDEIGNEAEAQAARTIAERGVQLIGTAHGGTLENLMLNPSLADLIGGIQAVTLSDDEAKRRGTQKTVLERKAPPTFDVVIELQDYDRLAIHHDVQKTVDLILRGVTPRPEVRVVGKEGVEVVQKEESPTLHEPGFNERFPSLAKAESAEPERANGRRREERGSAIRIYPYGIARTRLERAIREKKAPALLTNDIQQADAIIAIKSTMQNRPGKIKDLPRSVPTFVVKSNTFSQIANALDNALRAQRGDAPEDQAAVSEAVQAAEEVISTGKPKELRPQNARARKLQLRAVESRKLAAEAVGKEPDRRIRILPQRQPG